MRTSSLLRAVAVGAGLTVAGFGAWRHQATKPTPPDLAATGGPLRERVAQALATAAGDLEPEAHKAAAVPELRAAWKMDADQTTFQDLLENEEWWAPIRARFPVSVVLGSRGLLAALGPSIGDVAGNEIVKGARERGVASGLFAADGRAFLSAAARTPPGPGKEAAAADAPVVILGAPLDQAVLQRVAGQTGDVVGLSAGGKLVAITGPASSGELAAGLVGHESEGTVALGGGRVGVAWSAGPGVWLLGISAPVAAPARDQTGLFIAAGGIGLALLGLFLGSLLGARERVRPTEQLRRAVTELGPTPPAPQPAPSAHVPPAGSGTEIYPGGGTPAPEPGHTMAYRPTTAASAGDGPTLRPSGGPVSATVPAVKAPGQMGRYRLIERIGEGGMAEIFFAAAYGAEDFVRHFVVKRMHAHLARRREAVDQFIDEARLQAGLVHSNVVPVFDFGKADDEYFMALEYIHGRDVAKVVQAHVETKGGPLPERISCYVVHEVLEALAFAHSQIDKEGRRMEIVHRDVAPGNVLASYQGEVKLTDFGIAKAENRVSRTEVGMVKGNAQFMSPEQARGEAVDARSDIFSAGLVLYYCLTGQMLYQGETTVNRLLRAAVGPATAQYNQIGQFSTPVADILRRALAQDPAKRFATAEEFKRELAPHAGTRRELGALMDVLFPAPQRRDLR